MLDGDISEEHMADFDQGEARARHEAVMQEVQSIRDGINVDILDYYWDRAPQSEEDERENIEGLRKYLDVAYERIDELFKNSLEHNG